MTTDDKDAKPTADDTAKPRTWYLNVKCRTDEDPKIWHALLTEIRDSHGGLELVEKSAYEAMKRERDEWQHEALQSRESLLDAKDTRERLRAKLDNEQLAYQLYIARKHLHDSMGWRARAEKAEAEVRKLRGLNDFLKDADQKRDQANAKLEIAKRALIKNKSEWEAVNPKGYRHLVAWQVARDSIADIEGAGK